MLEFVFLVVVNERIVEVIKVEVPVTVFIVFLSSFVLSFLIPAILVEWG